MPARKIVKSKSFNDKEFTEILAEVPVEETQPWEGDAKLKVVGKPVNRVDGYEKVSGSAEYTFDVTLPNMTFAKTLRCPHPHANIKSIDTSIAMELQGVLAIISCMNMSPIPWYDKTSYIFDRRLRYIGDEVACVAAETEQIARDALELIRVEYEILPFVVDVEEAMKPGAPKLFEYGNIMGGKPTMYQRGDVETGFKDADIIVEDTFYTQVATHHPTEAHCSVAAWDDDHLTIWDSTQFVFGVRDTVAESLNIPSNKVRVIKKYMGGGFGSKLTTGKYTIMAALLARETGRPVKIVMDRKEMSLALGNRPNSIQKIKVGVKKDGELTALNQTTYGASGAYPASAGCAYPLRQLYKCENVKTGEYSVHINAGPGRPMRAPGHVQGTFGLDSMMDEAAEKIGMDPLEFRIKNYAEKDQGNNLPYSSKRLLEAYQKGAEAIGWNRRNRQPGAVEGAGSIKRGIGMASQIWWGAGAPPSYATIKLNRDGGVYVLSGTQDLGTGTATFMAQVAAEVLEIPVEKITITLGDTLMCPYSGISGGSLTAASVAPAVRDAAELLKSKLISGAAAALEIPENQLCYKHGYVSSKTDPTIKIAIPDIVKRFQEQTLIATGARNANPPGYTIQSFGAQFAEVEVDTETGKVNVLKIVAAHDVGRILNWKLALNQFRGGIIQGLGFALMEERIIDSRTGKVLNTGMNNYKMPTIKDIPEIEVYIVSDSDPLISSVGAKGIGEPAIIPTAASIANAVYNAIGTRIKSLPITPDKVLAALHFIPKGMKQEWSE